MRHLRVALEDAESAENTEIIGTLGEDVEALASIAEDLPKVEGSEDEEGGEGISLESAIRQSRVRVPSAVAAMAKFRASMESEGLGIAIAVGAAIAAVIALIAKAIQHFFGGKSGSSGGGGGGGGGGIERTTENVKEAQRRTENKPHDLKNLDSEIHREHPTIDGKTIRSVQDIYELVDPSLLEHDWVALKKTSEMVKLSHFMTESSSPLNGPVDSMQNADRAMKALHSKYGRLRDLSLDQIKACTDETRAIVVNMDVSVHGKQMSLADSVEVLREAYNHDVAPGVVPKGVSYLEIAVSISETLALRDLEDVLTNLNKQEQIMAGMQEMLKENQQAMGELEEFRQKFTGEQASEHDKATDALIREQARVVKNGITIIKCMIASCDVAMKWANHLVADEKHMVRIDKAMAAIARKHLSEDSEVRKTIEKYTHSHKG